MSKVLSSELISLIHYTELNKNGWWEETIQRLVLVALFLSKNHYASTDSIYSAIFSNFGLRIEPVILQTALQQLIKIGRVIDNNDSSFKVAESEIGILNSDIKDFELIEKQTREKFFDLASKHCPKTDPNKLWQVFNDNFLFPVIQTLGADTYKLITGQKTESHDLFLSTQLSNLICNNKENHGLDKVINLFLDPTDDVVRAYVLRRLNAYFCLEASNIDKRVLEKIGGNIKRQFKIFIDTNFLFSILGLHDNPSNDAAISLLNLIREISKTVAIKLYITPLTIEEVKTAIAWNKNELDGLQFSVLMAALNNLSGIQKKYAEDCKKIGKIIDASEYFEPYIFNTTALIRAKGLEIYNENLDHYYSDKRVTDDIKKIISRSAVHSDTNNSFSKKKSKTELGWYHDIIMWYFVLDKRPRYIESLLDAESWLATIDFRLLNFDIIKRKDDSRSIPVCLHPTNLMQIMQFFVPRSVEFEQAMFNYLKYPLLIKKFDAESEKITLNIVKTISRYQDVNDLPQEQIQNILLDKAFREKFKTAKNPEIQKKLLSNELFKKTAVLTDALEKRDKEIIVLKEKIGYLSSEKTKIAQKAKAIVNEANNKISLVKKTFDNRMSIERRGKVVLEERVKSLEKNALEQNKRKKIQIWYIKRATIFILSTFITFKLLEFFHIGNTNYFILLIINLALIFVFFRQGKQTLYVSEGYFFKKMAIYGKWVFNAIVLAIFITIIGNLLTPYASQSIDYFNNLFSNSNN